MIDALVLAIPVAIVEEIARHSLIGRLLLVLVIQTLYTTLLIGSSGSTLGMKAVGTKVVDANTAAPISMARALGRFGAQAVLQFPSGLFIGFLVLPFLDLLWPLWDGRNQTLHDKIASTVVIKT